MRTPRLQFICKRRSSSGDHLYGVPYGLVNSANLTARALYKRLGWETDVAIVTDNNSIDRVVTRYRPQWVILEALWVVPSKFEVLFRLHPDVKWVIRNHSEIPFLANEGNAFRWLYEYQELADEHEGQLFIASNSRRTSGDLDIAEVTSFDLLNIYSRHDSLPTRKSSVYDQKLHIGCFGAVRPMKNQLLQALAAIEFARYRDQPLVFHMNGDRNEQFGENNLRNIESVFAHVPGAELVEHPWMTHPEFVRFASQMDFGMQVSFTESFNIVAADFVSAGVPIVVSDAITWMPRLAQADPNSRSSIVQTLINLDHLGRLATYLSKRALHRYNEDALKSWTTFITETAE